MPLTFRSPFFLIISVISLMAKGFYYFRACIAEPFLNFGNR